jgi:hypothetical protein
MNGLLPFVRGAPVPNNTIKSGFLTSENMAVTSESAKMSGLFLRGLVS